MNETRLVELTAIALEGGVAASLAIMEVYQQPFETVSKSDGSPVTIADLTSNEILLSFLEPTGIPIISEESIHENYALRKNWDYCWCIDPLDGTKEFIKKNDEFAVCIALIHHQQPVLGFIFSPVEKKVLMGGKNIPPAISAFDTITLPEQWQFIETSTSFNHPLVITGSRSHQAQKETLFQQALREKYPDMHYLKKGSALKFFDLALGSVHLYIRMAPTMEWDIAAGQAILEALNGEILHAENNTPLTYNKSDLFNPFFIAKTAAYKLIE
jgi:3'(2'), 5'-bisphosphate nucleotidase